MILASSAFDLGVDCPDITRVINQGPPPTLEALLHQKELDKMVPNLKPSYIMSNLDKTFPQP